MNFEEIVQKAVNAEAKAGLRSSTMVWESDAYCPKSHHLSHNTFSKVQTQGTTAKEPRTKEFQPKEAKQANSNVPTLLHPNKPVKLNC